MPDLILPEFPERLRLDMLFGLLETVSAAPTGVPSTVFGQIKIYKNGATKRLYVFDALNNEWDFVALT